MNKKGSSNDPDGRGVHEGIRRESNGYPEDDDPSLSCSSAGALLDVPTIVVVHQVADNHEEGLATGVLREILFG